MNTSLSTKIQVGLGTIALAAATTISPVVAHATPGHAPFAQDQTGAGGGGKPNNPNKPGNNDKPGSGSSGSSGSSSGNSGARHTGRPGPAPGASTTTEAPATVGPATAAAPKAAATPKAAANPVGNLITVAVKITGTIVYGVLDTVAGVIRLTGQAITMIPVIGPPIGKVFIAVADATQKVAYAVAEATHVGPYSTTG